MTTRSISRRGWIIFVLASTGLVVVALIYRAMQPGPITRITEYKFYAIVRTPAGFPVPDADIFLTVSVPDGSTTSVRAKTNDAGRVELYYSPGKQVIVRIEKLGFAPRTETYIRPPGVRPDDKPLRVILDYAPSEVIKKQRAAQKKSSDAEK